MTDEPTKRNLPWRRIGLYLCLALAFFLLGLIPMALRARDYAEEREAAQHEVRLKQMETHLSSFQRDKLKVLLTQRDDVITLLARSDPAAVNCLSEMYVTYQKTMNDVRT